MSYDVLTPTGSAPAGTEKTKIASESLGADGQQQLVGINGSSSGKSQVTVGQKARAASLPTTLSTEDLSAILDALGAVSFKSDFNGTEQNGLWSLTTSEVTISVPDNARLLVVLAASTDIILRYGNATSGQTANNWGNGSGCPSAAVPRSYVLPAGTGRTIRVRTVTGSGTAWLEWRP